MGTDQNPFPPSGANGGEGPAAGFSFAAPPPVVEGSGLQDGPWIPDLIADRAEGSMAEQELRQAHAALARREQELLAALADATAAHEELRRAQLQLIQAEKMESVGRLAAGIAHEVKNPLAIISIGIDYLSRCEGLDSRMPLVLQRMRTAVQRADGVIRGLLDFSAPQALNAAPADLNAVVAQSLILVKHEIVRRHVKVDTELETTLPAVMLDRAKMEQVLVNLLLNAVQAMDDGGTLVVRTYCHRNGGRPQMVVAEVEDTGAGISEENLHRIFDPFFTTKPPGQGTGLGLTVARAIVELHGGTLDLANRAEGGVRGTVALHATEPAAADSAPVAGRSISSQPFA